jgi:bla regulator protein BlaR1
MMTMPDALLRALGWALSHSLWQGAVVAILLLILLPRLQTARQRYWAAYGALMVVLAAAAGTFIWMYEPISDLAAGAGVQVNNPENIFFFGSNQYLNTSLVESFSHWLESNHTLVVAIWLIGFVFFFLRLGTGLWQVHRLRTRGVHALEAVWQEKVRALSHQIGVSRSVRLFESAWVHAPLTMGWLKPVILLPIGFVNHLSFAEVEAVLAHELAHIARRDWIFNLLQAFVESLFYYHPAVWWISQIVRRERENACDDVALAATGNPLAFARALVQIQEMAAPLPALALALSGKRRRPLLERVRRILNQAPQQQHQVMEKITATVILLALLALVGLRANSVPSIEAAFAQIADIPANLFGGENDADPIESDSLPKPKNTRKITREDEDGRVEAEFKNGKITRLNIDGKEIPEAEFEAHEAIIEELSEDVPPPPPPPAFFFGNGSGNDGFEFPEPAEAPEAPEAPEPPEAREFFRFGPSFPALPPMAPLGGGISIFSDKDEAGNTIIRLDNQGQGTEVIVKDGAVWIDGKKMENGTSFDIPGINFGQYYSNEGSEGMGYSFGDSYAIARGISPEQREKLAAEMEVLREEHANMMKEYQRNFKRDQKAARKDWKKNQKEWEKQQKVWAKEQENWAREQEVWQASQEKWQAETRAMEAKNQAMQDMLKKELLQDGLIKDPEHFSLKLNATELKINKQKQSEAMHKKYLELIEGATGNKFRGENSFLFNFSD